MPKNQVFGQAVGGKTEQEITVSLLNRLVDDKMKKWNSWHCQKKGQKDV